MQFARNKWNNPHAHATNIIIGQPKKGNGMSMIN